MWHHIGAGGGQAGASELASRPARNRPDQSPTQPTQPTQSASPPPRGVVDADVSLGWGLSIAARSFKGPGIWRELTVRISGRIRCADRLRAARASGYIEPKWEEERTFSNWRGDTHRDDELDHHADLDSPERRSGDVHGMRDDLGVLCIRLEQPSGQVRVEAATAVGKFSGSRENPHFARQLALYQALPSSWTTGPSRSVVPTARV